MMVLGATLSLSITYLGTVKETAKHGHLTLGEERNKWKGQGSDEHFI